MNLSLSWRVWLLAVGALSSVPLTACSVLGAAVNIEPLEDGSAQVRALYSVLTSLPCSEPDKAIGQPLSPPVRGLLPSPGWCLRQWGKSVPLNHTSSLQLGSDGAVALYSSADLSVRVDTKRVNRPPFVSLPPPLRLQAGCPRDVPVYVTDLDEDEIRCRCEKNGLAEFLQLNEETCTMTYEGGATVGQYSVEIMVEDFPQSVKEQTDAEAKPLSTVSLHLLITVESAEGCADVPEFSAVSPAGGAVIHVLPFEELRVNITAGSTAQSVSEMAVVGPPGLFISPLENGPNFRGSVSLSWVRGPNQLPLLLSVCFAANTQSLQSHIRCMWIQQTQTDPLPPGTELKCKEKELEMSLVLPLSFLDNLHFSELQLNDPSCPVLYNATHVATTFSLTGCGTKRMHSGSELLYTNTLRSINPNTTISRVATLILPLACRIPGQQAKGPTFKISMPEEVKTFGAVSFWLEFHVPGEGPLADETRQPHLRSLQPVRAARETRATSRMEMLDLYVFSNCTLARAELMVGSCVESETQDFVNSQPLLNRGCAAGNGTLEILTSTSTVRVFRLYLSSLDIQGDTMYVQCQVHLCVTTKQSQKCPDPCADAVDTPIVENILTRSYMVRSGPVPLISKGTDSSGVTTVGPSQSTEAFSQPPNSQSTVTSASRTLHEAALGMFAPSLAVLIMKKLLEN